MLTLKSLDKVLVEVRGFHKKNHFCPKKNLLCYRLAKMSRNYRGGVVERMIRDYYKSVGKAVFYFGGNSPFDMIVNGHRVEVKSSLAKVKMVRGVPQYTYRFGHIRPSNFNKLVLVFISPEGITARIMDSRTVVKYTGHKNKHKDLFVSKKIFGKVLVA